MAKSLAICGATLARTGRRKTVPIGHVTNGVHLATWMASPVMALLDKHLGDDWGDRLDEPGFWDRVLTLDHSSSGGPTSDMKRALADFIREEARRRFAGQLKEAAQVVGAGTLLDPEGAHHRLRAPLRHL